MTTQQNTVLLKPIRENGVVKSWQMSMNGGPDKGPGNYDKGYVPKGDTATFTFTIVSPQGVSFDTPSPANPNASPIFIQRGTAKPTGGVDPQFANFTVSNQGSHQNVVLTLPDRNDTSGTYTYVLNFKGAPPLDPIIENGGPGIDSQLALIGGIIALAVIGAVAYLALRGRSRNRAMNGPTGGH